MAVTPGDDDRMRNDRRLEQLLSEVRVAMPGVQVLFAFLLAVPFQGRFDEVNSFQRHVYFVTLLSAAVASALFIAPTALHRLTFRQGQKAHIIRRGGQFVIGGLAVLGIAMIGAVLLVTDFIFPTATAIVTTACLTVLFAGTWFGLALARRNL